jgi:hypothetical protein
MTARSTHLALWAGLLAVLVAALSPAAIAQSPALGTSVAADPAPRRADGHPDLSGVWMPPYVPDMTANKQDQRGFPDLPFTAAGLADWKAYDAATGDYTGSCFPFGLMRSVNAPYPFQIMQDERQIAMLFEINTWHHVIPFARESPKQAAENPTWYGYSIGRWEGDTLVVETRGFNGFTRLDTIGHPHSDALHLTQTFRRVDRTHIAYTVTVDDPKTYTKPWTNERTFRLMNTPLLEYSCEENNKGLWEGRIKGWTPPWSKPQL